MRILAILGGVISLFMAVGIFVVTGLLAWEPIMHPVIGRANISFHGRHIIFTGQASALYVVAANHLTKRCSQPLTD
jgi:hypothetical protein